MAFGPLHPLMFSFNILTCAELYCHIMKMTLWQNVNIIKYFVLLAFYHLSSPPVTYLLHLPCGF